MAPGENNKATMDLASSQEDDGVLNSKTLSIPTDKSLSQPDMDDFSDEVGVRVFLFLINNITSLIYLLCLQ